MLLCKLLKFILEMLMSFKNKIVIITGAGRGIGAAVAKSFAKNGATTILVSRTLTELETVKASIDAFGGTAHLIRADVGSLTDIKKIYHETIQKYGGVDILINNAAIIYTDTWDKVMPDRFDELISVNVRGATFMAQCAFKQMMQQKNGGAIVNISSLSGLQNVEKFPGFGPYAMSKFAIIGLTESMAVEGKPYSIRVNAVAPGAVETKMLKKAAPFLKTSTMPEDIAKTVTILCDESLSNHLNGIVIPIFSNE